MLRPILTASALTLLLASATPAQTPATTPATPTELEQIGLTPPTALSQGYSARGGDVLVTKLIGQSVFSSINDDADEIGTITDMLVTSGLGITAVVVSVGGFLGLGAKPVAAGFDNLAFSADTAGTRYLFLNASRDRRETQRMVVTP